MADRRFFSRMGPFSLFELSDIAQAELHSKSDAEKSVTDVAALSIATGDDISFLDNKLYVEEFKVSSAGACIVSPGQINHAPDNMALLVTDHPYRAFARVASAFYPMTEPTAEIHPSACISDKASIGTGVRIGPHVTIMDDAEIGDDSEIGASTTIYEGVKLGENCRIFSNVSLQYCLIGDRVILHPGVRIGQDGFGFAMAPSGHLKVPQLGRVLIESDVEIGANTTVDRGTGPDTVIGQGCKIDNLVQIGHNARLGAHCIIVAQSGISGSTQLGNLVAVGGQVGISGHLKIGDGAQIAAQSGVIRSVGPGAKIGGTPAQPMNDWLRGVATLQKLIKRKG